jgi:hypothetical protein
MDNKLEKFAEEFNNHTDNYDYKAEVNDTDLSIYAPRKKNPIMRVWWDNGFRVEELGKPPYAVGHIQEQHRNQAVQEAVEMAKQLS